MEEASFRQLKGLTALLIELRKRRGDGDKEEDERKDRK
jgi:hypothetical protein